MDFIILSGATELLPFDEAVKNLPLGGQAALIGIGMVFAILTILIGAIYLTGFISKYISKVSVMSVNSKPNRILLKAKISELTLAAEKRVQDGEDKNIVKKELTSQIENFKASLIDNCQECCEDKKVVAAIVAAITMMYEVTAIEAGVEPAQFVVRKINRI